MTFMRSLFSPLQAHRVYLILIVLFGIAMRINNLSLTAWSNVAFDESRDMLVARHIAEHGELIWRGPFAAGSNNEIMNSPLYYYILAVIWFIARSPLAMSYAWALLLSTIIIIAYKTGREIWDIKLGLLFALLVAIHPEMISNSKQISQPFLIPLLTSGLLWTIWTKKRRSPLDISLTVTLVFAALHIHIGGLLLVPAYVAWAVYLSIKGYIGSKKVSWLLIPLATLLANIHLWLVSTYKTSYLDQITYARALIEAQAGALIFFMGQAVDSTMSNVFWHASGGVVFLLISGMIAVTIYALRKTQHQPLRMGAYLYMLCLVFSAMFCASFFRPEILPTYVLSTTLFFLIIIAIFLRIAVQRHVLLGIVTIACIVLPMMLVSTIFTAFPRHRNPQTERMHSLAAAIHQDFTNHYGEAVLPIFGVEALVSDEIPTTNWSTAGLWFYLEKYFDTQLITLYDKHNNYLPVYPAATYVYVFCGYKNAAENGLKCLNRLEAERGSILTNPTLVYTHGPTKLWRYEIIRHSADGVLFRN